MKVEEPLALPKPRHAMEEQVYVPEPVVVDDGPRLEVEALAMLSSLASDPEH